MARKKIREHDSKRLLRQHLQRLAHIDLTGLNTIQITSATNFQELPNQHPWVNTTKLVVKPDMLFGKRGKHNLVLLNADLEQAEKFVRGWFGKELEMSGVKGRLTHFLIEPFVPHKEEYYLSIVSERLNDIIRFSPCGGIEIEENWDQVKTATIEVGSDIDEVKDLDKHLGLERVPEESRDKIFNFIKGAYKVYLDMDFTLLETNPFTLNQAGEVIPLDMRVELDSTAFFKNSRKWGQLEFPHSFGREPFPEEAVIEALDEKTGASLKLTILNPEGRIWNMVAGGGASVIFADTVVDLGFGHELANYGEYSGAPNEEETYRYAKIIIDLATRTPHPQGKALIIGGGIANFTDVAKTFKGIIHALREYKEKLLETKMCIWVRRGGPNYEAGLKMMKDLGVELGIPIEVYGKEVQMTSIIPKAIAYIQGKQD